MIKFTLITIKLLVFLSFFSAFFAVLSSVFGTPIIRLWKELLIIVIIILTFISYYKINILKGFYIFVILLFFIINLFLSDNYINVVYQFKLDLLLLIFTVSIYFFLLKLETYQLEFFLYSLVKIIIILGFLNAIATISESIFFDKFINLLGINYGNWGTHGGLKIITTFGHLRAPGLLMGFVQSGTIILLSWTFFLYYADRLFHFNKFLKLFISIIFMFGLISTTYKTALLGFLVILLFYFIDKVNIKNKNFYFGFVSIIIFFLFFSSSISYWLYNMIKPYNESLVYNSVYLRVLEHYKVFEQIKTISDLLVGVGYGKNGTFGLKDNSNSIPLDSSFIYIFSNYGILGILIFLLLLLFLIIRFSNNNYRERPIFFYLIYILIMEFFYNNVIANFPLNYILSLLIITSVLLQRKSHRANN